MGRAEPGPRRLRVRIPWLLAPPWWVTWVLLLLLQGLRATLRPLLPQSPCASLRSQYHPKGSVPLGVWMTRDDLWHGPTEGD